MHDAHSSHAYQWLARRWGHLNVTLGVCAINVFWLLPCAIVAVLRPADAAAIALIALVPLACVALVAGAGRAEAGKRAADVSEVN